MDLHPLEDIGAVGWGYDDNLQDYGDLLFTLARIYAKYQKPLLFECSLGLQKTAMSHVSHLEETVRTRCPYYPAALTELVVEIAARCKVYTEWDLVEAFCAQRRCLIAVDQVPCEYFPFRTWTACNQYLLIWSVVDRVFLTCCEALTVTEY